MALRLAPASGDHEEEIASDGGEDAPHCPVHHRTGRDHHREAPLANRTMPTGRCATPRRLGAYAVSRRQVIPVSGPDSVVNLGWFPRGAGPLLTTPDARWGAGRGARRPEIAGGA